MLIKVCGMRDPENIRQVAEAGVNWMGFIFYARSPRAINKEELIINNEELIMKNEGDRPVKRVGVFVNASSEEMMRVAQAYRLDYLQLHGDESPEDCYALQKRGYALIKAFAIATKEDLEKTAAYEGRVDYFLFDTKCKDYGGSGRQFDWSVLSEYKGSTPFLLSGGISPDSLDAIRRFHHPRLIGFDLNSGFETAPGMKDARKVKEFVEGIRNNTMNTTTN